MEKAPLAVLARTEEVLAHPGADERLLNPVERERSGRFLRESARREFVAAHLLVRLCAAKLLGIGPDAVAFGQECPGCGQSGHGRPLLTDRPEVHLSLAHTDGVVAAAAGWAPVGIDVEPIAGRAVEPELLGAVLSPAEQELMARQADPSVAFLRQWVRKEALIKVGRAELDTLPALDLSALPFDTGLHRFDDLYVLDTREREIVACVVSPVPPLLVPLTDLAAG